MHEAEFFHHADRRPVGRCMAGVNAFKPHVEERPRHEGAHRGARVATPLVRRGQHDAEFRVTVSTPD